MPFGTAQLPPWLTETVKPSEIAMRGAQIGNILADNAMRAQQIGIQRDQQNAEMAMRQQAAEQAAQRFAAEQAQRAEEMELKKALAQTEQAKDAAQLIQSANEEQRKAQEAANRLMAQADYLKDQDGMKYLMRTAPAAAAQLQGSQLTATQRAAAAAQKMKFDEEQKGLDRLLKEKLQTEKLAVPKPDKTKESLERKVAGKEAELDELSRSTSSSVVEQAEKVRSELVNLRAQLKVAGGGTTSDIPSIRTHEEYNRLPKGAEYIAPDGSRRRKP